MLPVNLTRMLWLHDDDDDDGGGCHCVRRSVTFVCVFFR